jgi:transposase InsO family protein
VQNLLNRDFMPRAPNRLLGHDVAYIATGEGWLYLKAAIDLFSREAVGWAMKKHMLSTG